MANLAKPKLIEVALPLATINAQAAREKSIRHGHPSTMHLWWARRPLAATRAVIWASLVDDPSADPSLTPEEQEAERQRLFHILEELVVWENSNDPRVLEAAKAEIDRCFPDGAPPVLDPFGGGGAIPLEAQRLGLTALSGDLNPVAVLIQKAMIEIPPRFAGRSPVNPEGSGQLDTRSRAEGLAADVGAYASWMRDRAQERIGHLYPPVIDTNGEERTPIAWIWARTVESPDPAWPGHVPLVASWILSNRKGKPLVWVEPIIDRETHTISYQVREGGQPTVERTVNRGNGFCIATGSAIPGDYIKAESRAGRMKQQLLAVVAESTRGREYFAASKLQEAMVDRAVPAWKPEGRNPEKLTGGTVYVYGLDEWWKLFTPRQLVALTTFSDLLKEVRPLVVAHALAAGFSDDGVRLRDGGDGAEAYADAVITYLAFVVSKCADYWSSLCTWISQGASIRNTFSRQAIAMNWDFAETNPFSSSTGNWMAMSDWVRKAIEQFPANGTAHVVQRDARALVNRNLDAMVSTDPPYYDNISYADLSDFFYVWLRRNLNDVWPDELATLATPKSEELIANRYRAGSKKAAEEHFETGMADLMRQVAKAQTADVPATIYYAYKATETTDGAIRSTGWDTFLQGVVDAGLQVTATWPMRTEFANRVVAAGANALASSIVLACRPRGAEVPMASRGEFVEALKAELPEAVRVLQTGNIAPVDLAQSTIGPGIKIFSRYAKVVEADGSAMKVSAALTIINDVLDEILNGEEAELDRDTRFAVAWYSQHGYNPASSGEADSLANAKNTSLVGIAASGVGVARGGQFRLYEREELDPAWNPIEDERPTVWEATQHLLLALARSEAEAAELLHQLGGSADRARQLAYVIFKKATEAGWASEAAAYNSLIVAWPDLVANQGTASFSDQATSNQGVLGSGSQWE